MRYGKTVVEGFDRRELVYLMGSVCMDELIIRLLLTLLCSVLIAGFLSRSSAKKLYCLCRA